MLRKEGPRIVAVLAVAMMLIASAAPAGAARGPAAGHERLWPSLASLWTWVRAVVFPWDSVGTACDKGSSIDPNGGCHTWEPVVQTACDKGISIDPNGGCHT